MVKVTDALGNVTKYVYDRRNRLTETTDALGGTTVTVYDAVGNAVAVTDALGRTTYYQYDAMNRKIAVIQPRPDGTATSIPQPTIIMIITAIFTKPLIRWATPPTRYIMVGICYMRP